MCKRQLCKLYVDATWRAWADNHDWSNHVFAVFDANSVKPAISLLIMDIPPKTFWGSTSALQIWFETQIQIHHTWLELPGWLSGWLSSWLANLFKSFHRCQHLAPHFINHATTTMRNARTYNSMNIAFHSLLRY